VILAQIKWQQAKLRVAEVVDELPKQRKHPTSPICIPYNEGVCTKKTCREEHRCWGCGDSHPVWKCGVQVRLPYDAPPETQPTCLAWNMLGCTGMEMCPFRHICLHCGGPHPLRHTKTCAWEYHQDVLSGRHPDEATNFLQDRKLRPESLPLSLQPGRLWPPRQRPINRYPISSRLEPERRPNNNELEGPLLQANEGSFRTNGHSPGRSWSGQRKQSGQLNPQVADNYRYPFKPSSRLRQLHRPMEKTPGRALLHPDEQDSAWNTNNNVVIPSIPKITKANLPSRPFIRYKFMDICVSYNARTGCVCDHARLPCSKKHICRNCWGRHPVFQCSQLTHRITAYCVGDVVLVRKSKEKALLTAVHWNESPINASVRMLSTLEIRKVHFNEISKVVTGSNFSVTELTPADRSEVFALIVTNLPSHYWADEQTSQLQALLETIMKRNNLKDVFDIAIEPACNEARVGAYLFLTRNSRDQALRVLLLEQIRVHDKMLQFDTDTMPNPLLDQHRVQGNKARKVYYSELGDAIADSEVTLSMHLQGQKHQREFMKLPVSEQSIATPFNPWPGGFECVICCNRLKTTEEVSQHIKTDAHKDNNAVVLLSIARAEVNFLQDEHRCLVCVNSRCFASFQEFVAHCKYPSHRDALEKETEPCPDFNEKEGCQDNSCPFKHVDISSSAARDRSWRQGHHASSSESLYPMYDTDKLPPIMHDTRTQSLFITASRSNDFDGGFTGRGRGQYRDESKNYSF
jgi:hypothetical protein